MADRQKFKFLGYTFLALCLLLVVGYFGGGYLLKTNCTHEVYEFDFCPEEIEWDPLEQTKLHFLGMALLLIILTGILGVCLLCSYLGILIKEDCCTASAQVTPYSKQNKLRRQPTVIDDETEFF